MVASVKKYWVATGLVLAIAISARADTNIALQSNGGTALFGYDNPSTTGVLGTPYDHAGGSGSMNDGQTTSGGTDDTFGQPKDYYGFIGASFTLAPTQQINSVVFYGANFVDGGWFGDTGHAADDGAPNDGSNTLSASALIAPMLQYTTDGGVTWITDTSVTNDYVAQFTGASAGGGAPTNPATFTLTAPLTGVNGIRLIGEDGGWASGGGGFLGGHEIEVFAGAAVPEPSTWAMFFAGVALLIGACRLRSARA